MRIILYTFFTTLKRYKLSSLLNIAGLSVAFAAFLIIMIQIKWELSYNRFHPKADNIFRVEVSSDSTKYNVLVGRKWAELIEQRLPQITAIGMRMSYPVLGNYVKVGNNGQISGFKEDMHLIHPHFTNIFDFKMVDGDAERLDTPGQVIIPQSMAKRFFGDQSAVDKPLTFKVDADTVMNICGVYKDFPENTLVKNVIYNAIQPNVWSGYDGWNFNYELFVTLSSPGQKREVEKALLEIIHTSDDVPDWIKDYKSVRLSSLRDLHFNPPCEFDSDRKGDMKSIIVLLSIALLIIVITAINFINFATSLTPLRIKSLNTQKVFGASTGIIRMALIGEAMGLCAVSFILSLCIVQMVNLSALALYFEADLSLFSNIGGIIQVFGIVLLVGFISGIYPAFYSTGFQPAMILKGSFGLSSKGRVMRISLICFQYVVSILLIVVAIFMQMQNKYIRDFNKGYNTEQIAVMDLGHIAISSSKLLEERFKSNPYIKNVAFSQALFGNGDAQMNSVTIDGEHFSFMYFPVSAEFLRLMGVEIVAGRDFLPEDNLSSSQTLIFNDVTRKLQSNIEDKMNASSNTRVAGFCDNLNFKTLHSNNQSPLCFVLMPETWGRRTQLSWAYVKIDGDIESAIEHIKSTVESIDPTYPLSVQFYDSVFDNIYNEDRKSSAIITAFSLLAVIISLVGTFGVVFFETQFRRKEIGVRKVFGATIKQAVGMFNMRFIYIVMGCFVVASPIAYMVVTEWLKEFAYSIPLYWWVFVLSLLLVLSVTVFTVTIQSLRAALENPVKSLKSE